MDKRVFISPFEFDYNSSRCAVESTLPSGHVNVRYCLDVTLSFVFVNYFSKCFAVFSCQNNNAQQSALGSINVPFFKVDDQMK